MIGFLLMLARTKEVPHSCNTKLRLTCATHLSPRIARKPFQIGVRSSPQEKHNHKFVLLVYAWSGSKSMAVGQGSPRIECLLHWAEDLLPCGSKHISSEGNIRKRVGTWKPTEASG